MRPRLRLAVLSACCVVAGCSAPPPSSPGSSYPLHTGIVATTFWVGEIADLTAADGSQVVSAYDSEWLRHYGGCDGRIVAGTCQTETRIAENGFFPTQMAPRENPFYLDLPFDDIGDPIAFRQRAAVVPWAKHPAYRDHSQDRSVSFMKNRWVKVVHGSRTCYGQIEDAGPGEYHDAAYVFGPATARPANTRWNGAGMDVSPALNGCLGFAELNGTQENVGWQFVEFGEVPDGPWRRVITSSGVTIHPY